MRNWTTLLASVALLLATTALAAPEVGDVPHSFLGKDRENQKVRLKDLQGKVVIVTFWASWCPPCRKELPVLETIQQKAGTERIQVIAINIEQARAYRPMKRRLKDYTMKLINDHSGITAKRFGVKGIPHMVMIKKDGTISAIKRGYTEEMVPAMIEEVNALMRSEFAMDTETSEPPARAAG